MKKLLLTLVVLISFHVLSHAQTFQVMPKAGLSLSAMNFQNSSYVDEKIRAGFTAGLAFSVKVTEKFSIQPELLFTQKGANYKRRIMDVTGPEIQTRLHYLEIPVMARYHVDRFYLGAGPAFNLALGGKSKVCGTETDIKFGDGVNELRRTDVTLLFGGGAMFPLGKGNLVLDVRYGVGLSDIDNVSGSNDRTRNNHIAVTVGYALPVSFTHK